MKMSQKSGRLSLQCDKHLVNPQLSARARCPRCDLLKFDLEAE